MFAKTARSSSRPARIPGMSSSGISGSSSGTSGSSPSSSSPSLPSGSPIHARWTRKVRVCPPGTWSLASTSVSPTASLAQRHHKDVVSPQNSTATTHLTTSKTKQFCETSSIFELDNIKNKTILRDFLQKWKVECSADSLVPMRFGIVLLHLSKVLRLPRKIDARSYEVLHLSRKIILENLQIWCSKMQPLSGNERPDLLTSLMNNMNFEWAVLKLHTNAYNHNGLKHLDCISQVGWICLVTWKMQVAFCEYLYNWFFMFIPGPSRTPRPQFCSCAKRARTRRAFRAMKALRVLHRRSSRKHRRAAVRRPALRCCRRCSSLA